MRGGQPMLKKRKLNYRFHNPNPLDTSVNYILNLFIEVNQNKVEQAIQSVLSKENKTDGENPA